MQHHWPPHQIAHECVCFSCRHAMSPVSCIRWRLLGGTPRPHFARPPSGARVTGRQHGCQSGRERDAPRSTMIGCVQHCRVGEGCDGRGWDLQDPDPRRPCNSGRTPPSIGWHTPPIGATAAAHWPVRGMDCPMSRTVGGFQTCGSGRPDGFWQIRVDRVVTWPSCSGGPRAGCTACSTRQARPGPLVDGPARAVRLARPETWTTPINLPGRWALAWPTARRTNFGATHRRQSDLATCWSGRVGGWLSGVVAATYPPLVPL